MVAGRLAATKRCWSMAARMLVVAKEWRLMVGIAAGMLVANEGRKEDVLSWLLGGLQQPREGSFLPSKCLTIYRG
ncbi:hypothetical protein Pyn_27575 [Prunus yedoensis var. nudiflora]|uniref:Uncharacterized protein n=1 Tax=Prunus yedoensis var. nudiflora TaxID=2094558 RepID=A0A314U8M1_PRUYE|nr:hypothetical protein Pyn_27575 [Prunus yedoensis var. nudiflora]